MWLVLSTYTLLLLTRIADVFLLDRGNEKLAVILLELLIFALPAAVYLWIKRTLNITRLRISVPKTTHMILILSATLGLVSGGLLISIIFGGIDSLQSSFSLYDTFISKNDRTAADTAYHILAYALLPALCEEFIYRSILCAELEGGGIARTLLFGPLFFTLLHFDLSLAPVYFYSGLILTLVMYISRSVITSAAVHFLYNLFGLFSQPYITTFYKTTGSLGLFMIILTSLFLLSAALFSSQAARHFRMYSERNMPPQYRTGMTLPEIVGSMVSVIKSPAAILCILLFVISMLIK